MADDKRVDESWKQQARDEKTSSPEPPPPPPTFTALAMSLATQAMMALGLMAEPDSKEPAKPDLPRARYLVDLLTMLEEKTRHNLAPDEAKMLDDVLHDLRMAYVEASKEPERPSQIPPPLS